MRNFALRMFSPIGTSLEELLDWHGWPVHQEHREGFVKRIKGRNFFYFIIKPLNKTLNTRITFQIHGKY